MRSEETSVMSTVKRPGAHIWQISWQIYPPAGSAIDLSGDFRFLLLRAHTGRSTGRSTPPVDLPVDLNGNFRFLLLDLMLADEVADLWADLPPHLCHLVVQNGNFTFLLLQLTVADQPPQ